VVQCHWNLHRRFRCTTGPTDPCGFLCGDGWFDLVWRLCERLEPLVLELSATLPPGDRFEIVQVKQKMGELRFYVSHHNAARMESLHTCEHLRSPRSAQGHGWLARHSMQGMLGAKRSTSVDRDSNPLENVDSTTCRVMDTKSSARQS